MSSIRMTTTFGRSGFLPAACVQLWTISAAAQASADEMRILKAFICLFCIELGGNAEGAQNSPPRFCAVAMDRFLTGLRDPRATSGSRVSSYGSLDWRTFHELP